MKNIDKYSFIVFLLSSKNSCLRLNWTKNHKKTKFSYSMQNHGSFQNILPFQSHTIISYYCHHHQENVDHITIIISYLSIHHLLANAHFFSQSIQTTNTNEKKKYTMVRVVRTMMMIVWIKKRTKKKGKEGKWCNEIQYKLS